MHPGEQGLPLCTFSELTRRLRALLYFCNFTLCNLSILRLNCGFKILSFCILKGAKASTSEVCCGPCQSLCLRQGEGVGSLGSHGDVWLRTSPLLPPAHPWALCQLQSKSQPFSLPPDPFTHLHLHTHGGL